MIYFLKLIALEFGFIVLIGLAYVLLVMLGLNIAWCINKVAERIKMAIRKQQDWANMTVGEIAQLNKNQRKRYVVWLEAQKTKKEKNKAFNEFFEKSCEKYKD